MGPHGVGVIVAPGSSGTTITLLHGVGVATTPSSSGNGSAGSRTSHGPLAVPLGMLAVLDLTGAAAVAEKTLVRVLFCMFLFSVVLCKLFLSKCDG
jgi:hypothetical protein